MYLTNMELGNFKNYTSLKVAWSPRLNGLVGNNGVGKTNLLDAIYYLCMCKSYFAIPDAMVVQHQAKWMRLVGDFERAGEALQVVMKVQLRKAKILTRNGVEYDRLAEHIGLLPIVFIVPDDVQLVNEGSEERRRLLDTTLSQLDGLYLRHLMHYNKVLEQRNALLKQHDSRTNRVEESLLRVFDYQLHTPASYIHARRAWLVAQLSPIFETYYTLLSGGSEQVECRYVSQLEGGESMAALLDRQTEKDQLLQRTTVGIHRDDLTFYMDGHPVKKLASQGQLKSFVLALKLAQYELIRQHKQQKPILLLDDIFDKLDATRVNKLTQLLAEGTFGQVFMSDTHPARMHEVSEIFGAERHLVQVHPSGLTSL